MVGKPRILSLSPSCRRSYYDAILRLLWLSPELRLRQQTEVIRIVFAMGLQHAAGFHVAGCAPCLPDLSEQLLFPLRASSRMHAFFQLACRWYSTGVSFLRRQRLRMMSARTPQLGSYPLTHPTSRQSNIHCGPSHRR